MTEPPECIYKRWRRVIMNRSMTKRNIKRMLAAVISLLMLSAAVMCSADTAYAALSQNPKVRIAHATCDEKGKLVGKKPGDQTGTEVCVTTFSYQKGSWNEWTLVVRARDPKVARKIAKAAKAGAANDKIGYGMTGPSLYEYAEKKDFDLSKIKKKVNCHCVGFASACAAAAGLTDYSESKESNDTFKVYTAKSYVKTGKKLQPGDIIITSTSKAHHVAVVVKSPNKAVGAPAKTGSSFKKGERYAVLETIYPQTGPGSYYRYTRYNKLNTKGRKIAVSAGGDACIEEGTIVKCLEARGNWIRTRAGWIQGKDSYGKYIRKAE